MDKAEDVGDRSHVNVARSRRAVISIGTNSTRVLIVDVAPDGKFTERYHEAVLTRVGEGLSDHGSLMPTAVRRTMEVVWRYAARVREEQAACVGIATSAIRRADDGEAFRVQFRELTGVELTILSGEEEARCSFLGATYGLKGSRRVAVLDIGGGSTECAVGSGRPEAAVSVEIGAVRLTEMYPALAGHEHPEAARTAAIEADAYVATLLAERYAGLEAETALAVAGTPRTLGAMRFGARGRDVDGRALSIEDTTIVLDEMLALSHEARRAMAGMTPPRADILPAGAIIYRQALTALGLPSAIITRNDLLLGYLVA